MKKGFTLVEILVAVIILSIGILAVSQMTVMGLRVNTIVNHRMYARAVMAEKFEDLSNLPTTHPYILDQNGSPDLDLIDSTADYIETEANPVSGYRFVVVWNIAENVPELGVKTIRIHVLWGANNRNHISTDLIKRM